MIKKIILLALFIPSLANAGFYYSGQCYDDFTNIYKQLISENYNKILQIDSSTYVRQRINIANYYNDITSLPASTCPTNDKMFCIRNLYYEPRLGSSYYTVDYKYRLQTSDRSTGAILGNSSWYMTQALFASCEKNTSINGLEPVNITMTPPPGYDSFLNPSIDWATTEWIFGSGLVLFALGAGIGSIINITKKARI